MQLSDALILDAHRRNADGYMKVRARSARVGVYDYLGAEVDPEGKRFKAGEIVKVYRPAEEVFATDSLASFVAKPITDNHPAVPVNSRNWKDHARGTVFGAVDEDGARNYVSFDLAFMDAALIDAIDSGKRELSNGYSCDLAFEDGTAPDGTRYQAVQRNIRGNHVAVVDRGRAGPECRVNDGFPACDANPAALRGLTHTMAQEARVKIQNLDGMPVNLSDAAAVEAALSKLDQKLTDATSKVTGLEAKSVADAATIVAKDAEIAKLTADVAAAKPTLQQLRDAGKQFAVIEGKAKAMGVAVTDAMDEAAIMKAVVDKAMGEKAKDYTADHVAIAFEALTKDAKVADATVQPLGSPVVIGDSRQMRDAARQDYIASLTGQKKEAA